MDSSGGSGTTGEHLPTFIHEELLKYNGRDDPKVYLAIKGVVLDVSTSDFYKEGGAYHIFAGHDASVALAKMSKDPEHLDPKKYNWKDSLDENQ